MGNQVNYSLLELIEAPKRLKSIPHDKMMDYVLESCEQQDRFENFMYAIEKQAPWAHLGLAIMASDMIPFNKILEEELKGAVEVNYKRGSIGVYQFLIKLLGFFDRSLMLQKRQREYIIRYMTEVLADDEFRFVMDCLKQTYKKELYNNFKKMYEDGKMSIQQQEFFSFCMKTASNQMDEFTNRGFVLKDYKVYTKVGNILMNDDKMIDTTESNEIIKFLNKPINHFNLPNICKIFVRNKGAEAFLASTVNGYKVLMKPEEFDDIDIVDMMYKGYNTFICINEDNEVVSVISEENKTMAVKSIVCKNCKKYLIPFLLKKNSISYIITKDEEGKELTAFIPSNSRKKFSNGDTIKFVEYKKYNFVIGD